jgi:hypothetical protein
MLWTSSPFFSHTVATLLHSEIYHRCGGIEAPHLVRTYRTKRLCPARKLPESPRCFLLHGIGWGRTLNPLFTLSLIIAMLALVGVFIEIPFVTNYAFWVLFGAFVLLAGRK